MLLTGWQWVDPVVSIAISAVIVWGTWGLLKDSVNSALHAVPAGIDPAAVRGHLETLPGVAAIHDLHIWPMSTTETALTCHLVMPAGHPGDRFTAAVAKTLKDSYRIGHATLQIELGEAGCDCALKPDHVVCRQFPFSLDRAVAFGGAEGRSEGLKPAAPCFPRVRRPGNGADQLGPATLSGTFPFLPMERSRITVPPCGRACFREDAKRKEPATFRARPCNLFPRTYNLTPSLRRFGRQVAQDVVQDAAVLEVLELVERIDAAEDRHVLDRAVGAR